MRKSLFHCNANGRGYLWRCAWGLTDRCAATCRVRGFRGHWLCDRTVRGLCAIHLLIVVCGRRDAGGLFFFFFFFFFFFLKKNYSELQGVRALRWSYGRDARERRLGLHPARQRPDTLRTSRHQAFLRFRPLPMDDRHTTSWHSRSTTLFVHHVKLLRPDLYHGQPCIGR